MGGNQPLRGAIRTAAVVISLAGVSPALQMGRAMRAEATLLGLGTPAPTPIGSRPRAGTGSDDIAFFSVWNQV